MATCKFCSKTIQWGRCNDRWITLVPIGEEGDLERTHQDETGALRAAHRAVCVSYGAVDVVKLAKPIPADQVLSEPVAVPTPTTKRRKKA